MKLGITRDAQTGRFGAGRSPGPVNGSIRLPNGDSFRFVRSDIMRDAIASVTRAEPSKNK